MLDSITQGCSYEKKKNQKKTKQASNKFPQLFWFVSYPNPFFFSEILTDSKLSFSWWYKAVVISKVGLICSCCLGKWARGHPPERPERTAEIEPIFMAHLRLHTF